MKESLWRVQSRTIIKQVLDRAVTLKWTEKELQAALTKAYPFGERDMWPYKIWLDEIKVQRGTKKHTPKTHNGRVLILDTELQEKLF
jgi:hypothetical protein